MLTSFLAIVQHYLLANAYGRSLWVFIIAGPSFLTGPVMAEVIISQHLEQE